VGEEEYGGGEGDGDPEEAGVVKEEGVAVELAGEDAEVVVM
jgi:hypothetical protein